MSSVTKTTNVSPVSVASASPAQLLGRVGELLAEGRPAEALEAISRSRQNSSALQNARAVCLMRLGRGEDAVKILREVLFPHGSINVDEDLPLVFRLNFATAMVMTRNVVGAKELLSGVHHGQKHPMLTKLREAIRQWTRGLSLPQKLLLLLGIYPDKPVPLDFPPGEVFVPEEPPGKPRVPA